MEVSLQLGYIREKTDGVTDMQYYADTMKADAVQRVDYITMKPKLSKHGTGGLKMTEYERGFIDGIKSKVSAELTPTLINVSKTMLEMLKPVLSTALENALNDNNAITETDVQPVNQWISVDDRLPEEMQDKSINSGWSEELRPSDSVLILTTGGSYDVAWYSYAYNDWTTDNETHTYKNWEIAFWQPLPEAPLDR